MMSGNVRRRAALLAATLFVALALTGARNAHAQVCGAANLTVISSAPCFVNLSLQTSIGVLTWPMPPGTTSQFAIPPGTNIMAVISLGGNTYPWVPNPTAPPSLWVPNVTLATPPPPPSGCCVDVFYEPAACTIWIRPTTALPPCRP